MSRGKSSNQPTLRVIIGRLVPLLSMLLLTTAWVIVTLLRIPVIQSVFSILFLLTAPGFFLHRIIAGKQSQSSIRTLVNAVGMSLLVLMLSGLGLNQIGLFLHNSQPLTTDTISVVFGGVTVGLMILAQLRFPLSLRRLQVPVDVWLKRIGTTLLIFLPPGLAVGGAITLNNNGGNWLALLAMAVMVAIILAVMWPPLRLRRYLPFVLYSAGLTILLGTSMRGWDITGHDVVQEFQVYQLTLQHHVWNMAFYQDAYNACLSITILPTILQLTTGIADQYVYKLIYPLFVALTVPTLYLTVRPYVSRKVAFLVGGIFLSFSPFVSDFAMLNRQTTALLFFMLALQAGLNRRLSRAARTFLVFAFLVGMILSHYSTSYVAMAMLLTATVIGVAVTVFARLFLHRKLTGAFAIFTPSVVIAALMVLLIWNTFTTQTSNNIKQTLQGIVQSVPAFLAHGLPNGGSRTGAAKSGILAHYVTSLNDTRALPPSDYYTVPQPSQQVHEVPPFAQPINPVLAKLGVQLSVLNIVYSLAKSVYTIGILGLAVFGLVLIWVRSVKSRQPLQYVFLGIGGVALIGLQLVVPSNAINYGLLRVVQQTLIVLALPVIIALLTILRFLRLKERIAFRVASGLIVMVFMIMVGLLSAITGGDKPALQLSNDGFYYQAYLTHDTDIAADGWLKNNTPVGSRVYADEFARRQMIAYSGIFAQPTLIPEVLPVDSYAYISTNDTRFATVPFYDQGTLSYYTVPYEFLNANKNLVYSNGGVKIYK